MQNFYGCTVSQHKKCLTNLECPEERYWSVLQAQRRYRGAYLTADFLNNIQPGSFHNSINMGSQGVIPVAFLSDSGFDASTIDPATVTLRGEDFADGLVKLRGKKDAPVPMSNLKDVDDDGDFDLVVHLVTETLAAYGLDAICELGALTYGGYVVSGSDTIQIVPE
jgi:hypothetical protein